MSKRAAEDTRPPAPASAEASSVVGNGASAGPSQRAKTGSGADDSFSRAAAADQDEGMGEFEDQFEDEMESEDEAEGEGEEGMEIDGVRVSGEIHRPDDDEDDAEGEEQEEQVYLPGDKLEEGQTLEPDQSAYEMLHRLNVTWPCLSFDHLSDHLGSNRQKFPHTAYMVAGTQADVAKNNELMVMKASGMHKTQKDGNTSDDDAEDDDDDDDGLDDDAILEYRSIPVLGGINRVRAAPVAPPSSDSETCLDPYPVAAWSELGKVHIFDVRPLFNALDQPGSQYDKRKANMPLYTVEAHRGVEGYAMDWAGAGSSGAKASSLRLLTGDIHSNIYLTTSSNSGFTTSPTPFASHTSSVEDLQWSPSETTVFASCSADCSVRVWDVRVKSRKSVITVDKAHPQDVNVISWNRKTDYLLVSGGDEGGLNVWDLRNFKSNTGGGKPTPVASFQWHTAPISSVEWHPTEESVFAASGRDDQVTLWDLAVEQDEDEDGSAVRYGPEGREVPSQLLFCHQGQQDIKEVHWHPQIPGVLSTTALSGFNIFRTISV
ncbi:unnamed protein product [Parajaminaea phylloscopi]